FHHQAGTRSRPGWSAAGAAPRRHRLHARHAQAPDDAHLLRRRARRQRRGPGAEARARATPRDADPEKEGQDPGVERHSPGQERNRFLRLLSLELLFADEVCAGLLSDEKFLAAMARFEGALARVSAPAAHADIISRVCETARFDAAALAREGRAGTLAIPFVKALTAQVAAVSKDAAKHVHAGATSQDVIDTAVVLCLKPACARIETLVVRLGDAAAQLAHQQIPTAARTLLQPALPVTFGWKAAMWLSPVSRTLVAMRRATNEACVLQFGGPSGTLSSFGE